MGIMNLFHKKRIASEEDKILQKIQQMDVWLISEAPVYNLNFDVTTPTSLARAKYVSIKEQRERYDAYKEKVAVFIEKNFYGLTGDIYNLYDLYLWMQLCMTMAFRMVLYAPSNNLVSFVNLNEAISFFNNVFAETEELCKTIVQNMKRIESEMLEIVYLDGYKKTEDPEYIQYENGIKMIRDCKEIEQHEQLLMMFAECARYTDYLYSITQHIYENVPYAIDDNGDYMIIRNWKKTYENIINFINIENREHGIVKEEEFLKLIE